MSEEVTPRGGGAFSPKYLDRLENSILECRKLKNQNAEMLEALKDVAGLSDMPTNMKREDLDNLRGPEAQALENWFANRFEKCVEAAKKAIKQAEDGSDE